jgi:hypothetical protein
VHLKERKKTPPAKATTTRTTAQGDDEQHTFNHGLFSSGKAGEDPCSQTAESEAGKGHFLQYYTFCVIAHL